MRGRAWGQRFVVSGAVVAVVLACAGVAAAGHWKVKATNAGTAAADVAVLHKSDLGAGWKGSGAKPNLEATLCTGKKMAPVAATGAARILWSNSSLVTAITSQAIVLGSSKLVAADWKKTVLAPGVLACTKKKAAKTLPKTEKLLSLGWIKIPKLAKYTREARAIATFKGVKVVVDFLVVGDGKDEITLTFTAPQMLANGLGSLEVKAARKLLARVNAA